MPTPTANPGRPRRPTPCSTPTTSPPKPARAPPRPSSPTFCTRIHIRNHGAPAEATPTTRTNTPPTRQTHTLITRFRHFEDTIQQFATHLTPPTNNEAERAARPEKIQQPTSGGWRTRQGLTDFAIVQSYLDTPNGDVTNSTSSNNSPPPAPCNHQP